MGTADLTAPQVGERLQVSEKTLERWRALGIGPRWYRTVGGPRSPVRYPESEVDAYRRTQLALAASP